ncbi:hypothetical protein [Arsenicicoccus sp. oral taxon 190]|uniref:hypothetical protein n=1 Tax=Arsenicicoccus sp. oral taxon 190 TaxID=1658671 RepID=UPI00067A1686|nr:hypothetical protein [Arsenicicoccus sp. oral taxon 190]AKT50670.1 hypothetical protein ADJ73_03945 [Arsenicicoccus sp. oral taxon 190]
MPTIETGHEHEGRGAVLTLSTPLLAELDESRVRHLVAALVELSGRGGREGDVADLLAERLQSLGIEQPRPVVESMAENLRNGDRLTVVTDEGQVLHGDPSWSPATHDPDVQATEDPLDEDRPLYS